LAQFGKGEKPYKKQLVWKEDVGGRAGCIAGHDKHWTLEYCEYANESGVGWVGCVDNEREEAWCYQQWLRCNTR
jgi:hypothetical protein